MEFMELKTPAIRNPNNKDPSITKYRGMFSNKYPGNFSVTRAVF